METIFKNPVLKNDIKDILSTPKSIKIDKGKLGGCSIEIENILTGNHSSYVYVNKDKDRNHDYDLLLEVVELEIEKSEEYE